MSSGIKVIGAGLSRTGTNSLRTVLDNIGFAKCYHGYISSESRERDNGFWANVIEKKGENIDWNELFEKYGYQSAVDSPPAWYWQQIHEFYPNSKVILTKRDQRNGEIRG
eukprot:206761_1